MIWFGSIFRAFRRCCWFVWNRTVWVWLSSIVRWIAVLERKLLKTTSKKNSLNAGFTGGKRFTRKTDRSEDTVKTHREKNAINPIITQLNFRANDSTAFVSHSFSHFVLFPQMNAISNLYNARMVCQAHPTWSRVLTQHEAFQFQAFLVIRITIEMSVASRTAMTRNVGRKFRKLFLTEIRRYFAR